MSALVRWLPKLAVATADDIARFGPNAARVKTLLDFIPTMSEDAARMSYNMYDLNMHAQYDRWGNALYPDPLDAERAIERRSARYAAGDAARAEVTSDIITPEYYRLLTNPLAMGRAVDVLAPRYKDTPFREMLQELGRKKVIMQPSDVLAVGRIARSPEDIREIAMTLIADGMAPEDAIRTASML